MAMVAYKLLKALGDNEEGSVVHLDQDVGKALCDAKLAEEAKSEDMNSDDEEVTDSEDGTDEATPLVANSAKKLSKVVTKAAGEAVAAALKQANKPAPNAPTVPAEVKQGPIFKSTGAYVRAIIDADIRGNKTAKNKVMAHQEEIAKIYEKRGMQTKSILGMNETTNASGGYLVNPEFSKDVYSIPHGQIDLQNMATTIDAKSNVYNQRFVNESSLANGSIFGGLNVVATGEGASFTSSLPAWNNVQFTLQKLALFVYYTTEILEDASYPIEAELDEYATKAFVYGLNTQIVQGSTLEGFLNTPALVTVTSSANDTAWHTTPSTALTYADLSLIWSSVYPDCQASPGGVWLFHPSLSNCLTQMTYTFSGSNPAWGIQYDAREGLKDPSGNPMTPYRIFGKPAYPCWACSAPGVAGDIIYVDMNTVKRYARPFRVEISKDFQFGTDQVAVRYVARLDERTIFRNKITGVTGTQQFSAIVTRSSSGT